MLLALTITNQHRSACGDVPIEKVTDSDAREIYGDAMEPAKFLATTGRYITWVHKHHGALASHAETKRILEIVDEHRGDYDLVWYLKAEGEL